MVRSTQVVGVHIQFPPPSSSGNDRCRWRPAQLSVDGAVNHPGGLAPRVAVVGCRPIGLARPHDWRLRLLSDGLAERSNLIHWTMKMGGLSSKIRSRGNLGSGNSKNWSALPPLRPGDFAGRGNPVAQALHIVGIANASSSADGFRDSIFLSDHSMMTPGGQQRQRFRR